MNPAGLRVILIGGTSHAGKTTVARALAEQLGWEHRSTDRLARHPGRPWQTAPGREELVASHYASLTVDDLIADVLRHYKDNVWPIVERIVAERLATDQGPGLVIEGSAVLPELVAKLGFDGVGAAWLVADDELLQQRIRGESGFAAKGAQERALIDKFLARTLRFNELLEESLERLGLTGARVAGAIDDLARTCLAEAVAYQHARQERPEPG